MPENPAHQGLSTLVNHLGDNNSSPNPHLMPIYQTSIFRFSDVAEGCRIVSGSEPGYYYNRLKNPNREQVGRVIAALEGLDLLRANPVSRLDDLVAEQVFASGMAVITSVIMARAHTLAYTTQVLRAIRVMRLHKARCTLSAVCFLSS